MMKFSILTEDYTHLIGYVVNGTSMASVKKLYEIDQGPKILYGHPQLSESVVFVNFMVPSTRIKW